MDNFADLTLAGYDPSTAKYLAKSIRTWRRMSAEHSPLFIMVNGISFADFLHWKHISINSRILRQSGFYLRKSSETQISFKQPITDCFDFPY